MIARTLVPLQGFIKQGNAINSYLEDTIDNSQYGHRELKAYRTENRRLVHKASDFSVCF